MELVVAGGAPGLLWGPCDATVRSGVLFATGAPLVLVSPPATGLSSTVTVEGLPSGERGETRTGLAAPACLLFSDDAPPVPPPLPPVVRGAAVPLDDAARVKGRGGTRVALVAPSGLGCGRVGMPHAEHTGTDTGGLPR